MGVAIPSGEAEGMSDERRQQLTSWARGEVERLWPTTKPDSELTVVSGDASFRRYFRLACGNGEDGGASTSFIAVDAPPATEDSEAFVDLSKRFIDAGLRAPRVYASNFTDGWMLLEDLGDRLLLPELLVAEEQRARELYTPAFAALVALQCGVDASALVPFDEAKLIAEMELFETWFLTGLLELTLDHKRRELLKRSFSFLADAALVQPQVAVHRDFHSRNLMLLEDGGLGIIDFQDAVSGAYTYDLVSLLRDCYVSWPAATVQQWANQFHTQLAEQLPAAAEKDEASFLRDFDLMGLQRHLKVMGIFARLHLRDKKSAYLADIPLVMDYFSSVARQHAELAEFVEWFDEVVEPRALVVLNDIKL